VNFDVRVLGKENIALIESMIPVITDGKRPRVHFSIGDAYADAYWKQQQQDQNPSPRAQFKGRLLRVSEAKQEPQRELLSYGMAYVNGMDHTRARMDTCVLHGNVNALEKNYTTVNIPQERSVEIDKALDAVIAAGVSKAKVLAGIVLRDMQCSAFVFREGSQNAGQLGTNVNAVLHGIRWVKVEGETVYQLPKQQAQEPVAQGAEAASPQADDDADGYASRFDHAFGTGFDDIDDQIPF
jgi:hypothetical protein